MNETAATTESLADKLAAIPAASGCYIYKGAAGDVLYIGKAVSLRSRVRSYFQRGATHGARIARMVTQVRDLEWIVTDSEVEALILECTLIKKHRPPFNIRLRDDKSYPYVCVTVDDPFPRVFFTRRPRFTRDRNRYFGPYTNARAVRDTLRTVRRIFGIQSCKQKFSGSERQRPCLYYHLGQCLGPCTGDLSIPVYRDAVDKVCMLFEGRHEIVLRELEEQMEEAAVAMQFERAAGLRDRIRALEGLTERQKVFSVEQVDRDVIGLARDGGEAVVHVFFVRRGRLIGQESFDLEAEHESADGEIIGQFLKQYYQGAAAIPREILAPAAPDDRETIEEWLENRCGRRVHVLRPVRGEKRRMVEMVSKSAGIALENRRSKGISDRVKGEQACLELAEALELQVPPVRIECYDISNLQGGFAVGSMVVFEGGLPAKREYRHFRIRTVEGQDDFASMREVISRRLARAKEGDVKFADLPDLMLIDGGKGQLSAALGAVGEADEQGLALAALAKKEEELFLPQRAEPVRLPRHSSALRLVQHIRDEAHRFAVSYHRKLRGKGSLHSELDNVPGIGKTRRTKLIKEYGSLEEIRKLSPEELSQAPGMNRRAANLLYGYLHGTSDGDPNAAA